MWRELEALPKLLQQHGYRDVEVFWGFGCKFPLDDLWQSKDLPANDLVEHAKQGAQSGLFTMGRGDLYVCAPDKTFEYQFCHDSDLHFGSIRPEFVTTLRDRWITLGFPGFTRTSDNTWEPFRKP
jgi:hypothetical protein